MADLCKEIQLYDPVRRLLEKNGYLVKAEVNDCDIVAFKEDKLALVDLKLQFNLKVV